MTFIDIPSPEGRADIVRSAAAMVRHVDRGDVQEALDLWSSYSSGDRAHLLTTLCQIGPVLLRLHLGDEATRKILHHTTPRRSHD